MAEDITPRHLLYGVIITMLVILSGITMFSSLDENGSFSEDSRFEGFNSSMNQYEDVINSTDTLRSNIEDSEEDVDRFGMLNSLIQTSWQSLKLIFSSFSVINTILTTIAATIGIPSWAVALLFGIIIVIIAFTIWGAIFQTRM